MWAKRILANSQAKGTARLVLLAAGEFADKNGFFAVPVPVLAALANVRDRQVQYDLKELCAMREIHKDTGGKGGRGTATGYQITVRMTAPFPAVKRVQSMKGVLDVPKMSPFAPFASRGRAQLKANGTNPPQGSHATSHEEASPFAQ